MKTLSMFFALLVASTGVRATVENFSLLDHEGRSHELYYYGPDKDTKLIVLFVQGNACPLVRKRIPELNLLKEHYEKKGVRFWMINANLQDEREDIIKEAKEFNITWPILKDETQLVAQSLDISRTAETLVINPRTWEIIYRGALDDRLTYETDKEKPKHTYLRDVLDASLKGKKLNTNKTDSPGCAITFDMGKAAVPGKISYSKTIAPILLDRCVRCHQVGGIGPFALSSYKKVRGWSGMIREVIMTRRMPPWQADPHFGTFSNDFSLTTEEKKLLIGWIDAGSPSDEGPDPLALHQPEIKEWLMGEPDLIVTLPEQKIPAEGVVPYIMLTLDLPIEEDVWMRASQLIPGNTKVLHHGLVAAGQSSNRFLATSGFAGTSVGGYVPGYEAGPMPKDTGRLIKAGSKLHFQLHYTVTGKPETDTSRFGLYFHKERPKKVWSRTIVLNLLIRIPPFESEYVSARSYTFRKDAILYTLFPHMHYRGKYMSFEAQYPDGKKEILLSVPNYDFNWQRGYNLKEPLLLPAGTKIVVTAAWDNSNLNPHNPDPSKTVFFGLQSYEEMFYAPISFIWADSST